MIWILGVIIGKNKSKKIKQLKKEAISDMKNIYEYLLSKNYRQVYYPENSPLYADFNESSFIASTAIWSLVIFQFFVSVGGMGALVFFSFFLGAYLLQKQITESKNKLWGSNYVNCKITDEVWGNSEMLRGLIENLMVGANSPEQFKSSGKYTDLLKFYAQRDKEKFHKEFHDILLEYWIEVRGESKLKIYLNEEAEPGFIKAVSRYFKNNFNMEKWGNPLGNGYGHNRMGNILKYIDSKIDPINDNNTNDNKNEAENLNKDNLNKAVGNKISNDIEFGKISDLENGSKAGEHKALPNSHESGLNKNPPMRLNEKKYLYHK